MMAWIHVKGRDGRSLLVRKFQPSAEFSPERVVMGVLDRMASNGFDPKDDLAGGLVLYEPRRRTLHRYRIEPCGRRIEPERRDTLEVA